MTHPPRWLTTLCRASEHRRDAALQQLGQCVSEAESLRRVEQDLNRQLTDNSMNQNFGNDPLKLDLERLHQCRKDRNELRIALSNLQLQQERCVEKIAQQRETVQQRTSESRQLDRLSERITIQQAAAIKQIESRLDLEDLAFNSQR